MCLYMLAEVPPELSTPGNVIALMKSLTCRKEGPSNTNATASAQNPLLQEFVLKGNSNEAHITTSDQFSSLWRM